MQAEISPADIMAGFTAYLQYAYPELRTIVNIAVYFKVFLRENEFRVVKV